MMSLAAEVNLTGPLVIQVTARQDNSLLHLNSPQPSVAVS